MRVLLDTCIFIHLATDKELLSNDVLSILDDYENTLCVSAETIRELIIQFNKGKLVSKFWKTADAMVDSIQNDYYINILPLKYEHMRTYANLRINTSREHKDPSDHVIIAGEVESANEFMLSKDIMIVPLLSGSGIRIKIIEGMALGKTIITTSIGAEGLNVENGKNIFIADTAEEFVAVIEKCVRTPDICTIIGENARHYVALNHNNEVVTQELIDFYHEIS